MRMWACFGLDCHRLFSPLEKCAPELGDYVKTWNWKDYRCWCFLRTVRKDVLARSTTKSRASVSQAMCQTRDHITPTVDPKHAICWTNEPWQKQMKNHEHVGRERNRTTMHGKRLQMQGNPQPYMIYMEWYVLGMSQLVVSVWLCILNVWTCIWTSCWLARQLTADPTAPKPCAQPEKMKIA
jgi:hypothetical protein